MTKYNVNYEQKTRARFVILEYKRFYAKQNMMIELKNIVKVWKNFGLRTNPMDLSHAYWDKNQPKIYLNGNNLAFNTENEWKTLSILCTSPNSFSPSKHQSNVHNRNWMVQDMSYFTLYAQNIHFIIYYSWY